METPTVVVNKPKPRSSLYYEIRSGTSHDRIYLEKALISPSRVWQYRLDYEGGISLYKCGTLHRLHTNCRTYMVYDNFGNAYRNNHGHHGRFELVAQADCNMVLYDPHKNPIWSTNSCVGHGQSVMHATDDGIIHSECRYDRGSRSWKYPARGVIGRK